MLINEKIRFLKQQKGLSQDKMARQLKIATNGYGNISSTKLKKIDKIFVENLMHLSGRNNKNIINTMGSNNTGTQNNQNFCSLFLCPCPCTKNSQLECNLAKQILINIQQSNEINLLKQLNALLMEKIESNKTDKNLSTIPIKALPG